MDRLSFEVDDEINTTGTSKRGQIRTTFKNITSVFGAPTHRMGNNSFNEWRIRFRVLPNDLDDSGVDDFDYLTATIYDWSEETDPARNPTKEYIFNIGGMDLDAAYYVHQLLGE